MVHLINEYKDIFFAQVDYEDNNQRKLTNSVLKNSKVKIPIFCELGGACDYWMGIGKVSQKDMLIDYNELEDYEGKELTIIARLESRKYYRDKPFPVFDTNVLLNLYRYSAKTRKSLLAAFENFKGRVWIPYQVAYGYMRKRCEVIYETVQRYEQFKKEMENFTD